MAVEPQRIDVSIEPLDEYLVIQPSNDETETRSGLILPASAAATVAVRTGIVTAIGTEVTGIEVKLLKRSDLIARVHD
jgi:co-chaperonin GroES (HSP10)